MVLLLLALGWPFSGLKLSNELTPQEDRGFVRIFVTAPEGSSIAYMDRQLRQVEEVAQDEVERGNAKRVITRTGGFGRAAEVNTGMVNLPLNLWEERDDSAGEIATRLRERTQNIPGRRINVNQAGSPLSRNSTRPLAIALGGGDYAEIVKWRDKIMQRVAAENPRILNLESDYLERQPRVIVQIDRNKAADLGVSLQPWAARSRPCWVRASSPPSIAAARNTTWSCRRAPSSAPRSVTSTISTCVRTRTATCCRCRPWCSVEERAGPAELRRTDRMRAIELAGSLAPGYALGDAVSTWRK